MHLCTFSKSEVHADSILCDCPLALTATLAKRCPCRKRIFVDDLRLLSCTHPTLWHGEMIRDSEALVANLKRKHETEKENRRLERKIDMSTTTAGAAAAANGAAGKQTTSPTGKAAAAAASTAISTKLASADALAVSLYQRITDPIDAINKLGKMFADSCMFGCNNVDQGRVLAMTCISEGRPPSYYSKRFHIIGGNMSMKADAMLAEFRLAGGRHRIIERSPERCAVELTCDGQKLVSEFTWADASQEEYPFTTAANKGTVPKRQNNGQVNPNALKDNWATPRKRMQMLWARVVSDGVRALMPEVNFGQYTPEELSGSVYAEPQEASSDVIDAEYEVASEPAAEAVTAEAAPFEPAAEVKPEAKPAETKSDAKSEAAPGSPEAQLQTPPNANADADAIIDMPRLLRLKELKDAIGYTPEDWTGRVLAKFKVPTAKQLTRGQADMLILALENKLRQSTGKDALSQWADNAGRPEKTNVKN